VALATAALAVALEKNATAATVPLSLVQSVIHAARLIGTSKAICTGAISGQVAALTEGVGKAMFMEKVKSACVVAAIAIGAVGAGTGMIGVRAWAQDPGSAQNPESAPHAALPRPTPASANEGDIVEHIYKCLRSDGSYTEPSYFAIFVKGVQDRRLLGLTVKLRKSDGTDHWTAMAREGTLSLDEQKASLVFWMSDGEITRDGGATRDQFQMIQFVIGLPKIPDVRDVQVHIAEDKTASLLFGVGINYDAGQIAELVKQKPADAEPKNRLPKGPAPHTAFAVLDGEGRLVLRIPMSSCYYQPRTTYQQRPDGGVNGITSYELVGREQVMLLEMKNVRGFGTDGRRIETNAIAERLKKEIPVLVSANGQPVDPFHLQLIKEGTIVLVISEVLVLSANEGVPRVPQLPVPASEPPLAYPPPYALPTPVIPPQPARTATPALPQRVQPVPIPDSPPTMPAQPVPSATPVTPQSVPPASIPDPPPRQSPK
jgi:hypothetical protein